MVFVCYFCILIELKIGFIDHLLFFLIAIVLRLHSVMLGNHKKQKNSCSCHVYLGFCMCLRVDDEEILFHLSLWFELHKKRIKSIFTKTNPKVLIATLLLKKETFVIFCKIPTTTKEKILYERKY